jgi:hypothetical protein
MSLRNGYDCIRLFTLRSSLYKRKKGSGLKRPRLLAADCFKPEPFLRLYQIELSRADVKTRSNLLSELGAFDDFLFLIKEEIEGYFHFFEVV